MTEKEIKQAISKKNETVQDGYLWVYLDGTIQIVYLTQYLDYLGKVAGESGFVFVYDPFYKIVRKYSLKTGNPKYYIDDEPLIPEKDVSTSVTENTTTIPQNSTNLSFDFSGWIPYISVLAVIIVIAIVYQKNSNNQFY